MEAYKYTGRVHQVSATQTFPSGFAKRVLVVRADGDSKYPDYAAFEFTRSKDGKRDGTRLLDALAEGDEVEVSFYLSANESRAKPGSWFSSNRGVKVERIGASNAVRDIPVAPEPPMDVGDVEQDEMPF